MAKVGRCSVKFLSALPRIRGRIQRAAAYALQGDYVAARESLIGVVSQLEHYKEYFVLDDEGKQAYAAMLTTLIGSPSRNWRMYQQRMVGQQPTQQEKIKGLIPQITTYCGVGKNCLVTAKDILTLSEMLDDFTMQRFTACSRATIGKKASGT